MKRVRPRESGGNQQVNLLSAELRPLFIGYNNHLTIEQTTFAHAMPPRRTKMVATLARISVEQNADLQIVRLAQSLDVNARALIFWHD